MQQHFMPFKKELIFDLIPGYGCNFRCSYCFNKRNEGKAYKNMSMSEETIKRTTDYMKYVMERYPNYIFHTTMYGGEPLLYTDIIEELYDRCPIKPVIVTNGILIDKKFDWIKNFQLKTHRSLFICVSYDYSLQNVHRQDNTYDIVRNNIRLLYQNDIPFRTITVFPRGDLPLIYDVYMDYLELLKEIPTLKLSFNIDRVNVSNTQFDEIKSQKAFEKIQNYNTQNNLVDTISYNINYDARRTKKDNTCLWGNVFSAIDVSGDIYPCCNSVWEPDNILDIIHLGNIYEDFSVLDDKRKSKIEQLSKYPYPNECLDCNVPCRVMPWRTIKNDISEYNGMPPEDHCRLHKMLAKYLMQN